MEKILIRIRKNEGIGLIESLIAVSIMVVVVSVAGVFYSFYLDNYSFSFEETRQLSEAQGALKVMLSEIREAQLSEEGGYPLVVVENDNLVFFADIDNDGEVERVRFSLVGTSLERGVIEPGVEPNVYDIGTEQVRVLSDYIQNGSNPVFYYYNGSWPGDNVNNPLVLSSRLLETRLIEVRLTVNTGSDVGVSDLELKGEIMVRNLKTN